MATKPTAQPEIWASATLYASGPKVGQPTKASSEAGAAVEGHKPGPTEPTTANEFNVFENKMSLLARWTFEGRFDKLDDAHIVETDTNGLLSARAADFGDPTKPGPSLNVVNSNTAQAVNITTSDNDGLRVQGLFTPADATQLVFVDSAQDNAAQKAAIRVRCTADPSSGGIRIEANAAGTISGQEMVSAMDISNSGGTGLQCRTDDTIIAAIRSINLEDGGTSGRFGHGDQEIGAKKNLDGTALDAKGGDADGTSLAARAGSGILAQGGAFTSTGTPKPAGHGVLALSGSTSTSEPGGAAVFAQTVGPRGIAMEASHNDVLATLPVVQATTGDNAATAFRAVVEGTGQGLDVEGALSAGIRCTMFEDGGNNVGPALDLQNQLVPTLSPTAGHMWQEQGGAQVNLRCGVGVGDRGYVRVAHQPQCYARSNQITAKTLITGAQVDVEVAPEFSWAANMVPAKVAKVRVTIWAQIAHDADDATSVTLDVRDKTAGGDPVICSVQVSKPDLGAAVLSVESATISQIYTLPASGARDFDLVWSGTAGVLQSGIVDALVEIEEIAGD